MLKLVLFILLIATTMNINGFMTINFKFIVKKISQRFNYTLSKTLFN